MIRSLLILSLALLISFPNLASAANLIYHSSLPNVAAAPAIYAEISAGVYWWCAACSWPYGAWRAGDEAYLSDSEPVPGVGMFGAAANAAASYSAGSAVASAEVSATLTAKMLQAGADIYAQGGFSPTTQDLRAGASAAAGFSVLFTVDSASIWELNWTYLDNHLGGSATPMLQLFDVTEGTPTLLFSSTPTIQGEIVSVTAQLEFDPDSTYRLVAKMQAQVIRASIFFYPPNGPPAFESFQLTMRAIPESTTRTLASVAALGVVVFIARKRRNCTSQRAGT